MSDQFLNTPDDVEWLMSTHLKGVEHPKFESFILYGNEDSPTRLELFPTSSPTYFEKPIITFILGEDGYFVE